MRNNTERYRIVQNDAGHDSITGGRFRRKGKEDDVGIIFAFSEYLILQL